MLQLGRWIGVLMELAGCKRETGLCYEFLDIPEAAAFKLVV